MRSEIQDMFSLSNQVALVIGGVRHLGFDMASVLAAAGADLIITSRSLEYALESSKKLTQQYHIDTLGLRLDHTDAGQVENVIFQATEWKGFIHILINNAGGGGVSGKTRLLQRDPCDIEKLIQNSIK